MVTKRSALDDVGCPPDKIKRILRWVSDEALQTYVRDGERMYTKWLDKAPTATIKTVQVSNLPSPVEAILDYVDYHESDDEGDDS